MFSLCGQLWSFKHFEVAGDYFNYVLHEHPLIKKIWDNNNINVEDTP